MIFLTWLNMSRVGLDTRDPVYTASDQFTLHPVVSAPDWISVHPAGCLSVFHLQPDVQNRDVIQLPFSSGSGWSELTATAEKMANKAGTFCCIFISSSAVIQLSWRCFCLNCEVNFLAFRGENGIYFASVFSAQSQTGKSLREGLAISEMSHLFTVRRARIAYNNCTQKESVFWSL